MRIIFMGTPESAVPSLRRLIDDGHEVVAVWTQPDKPAGRGRKIHESPIKTFALQHNLTVHQPARIKNPDAKELFASYRADLAVVVAYGKILPSEFLSAPTRGCVNVHFSLLPKYRGAAPVNWAIVNGDEQTGVTTMKIVEHLDAGPILLQKETTIAPDETAPQLLARLAEIGAELLSDTVRDLDNLTPQPQVESDATLAPILKREDGLIDWSMDAFAIERRVRGFQPWPNAYTSFRSRRLIVWQAKAQHLENASGNHGEIIEARGDRLGIACGQQTQLLVRELQTEDARRTGTRDFLNGAHVKIGETLGQE